MRALHLVLVLVEEDLDVEVDVLDEDVLDEALGRLGADLGGGFDEGDLAMVSPVTETVLLRLVGT